jgi:hypothetical protein
VGTVETRLTFTAGTGTMTVNRYFAMRVIADKLFFFSMVTDDGLQSDC